MPTSGVHVLHPDLPHRSQPISPPSMRLPPKCVLLALFSGERSITPTTCSWCDQPEILERCPPTKPPKAGLLLPSQSFYPNSGTKEQAVIMKPPRLIQGPGHTRKPTIRVNHRTASWSRWRVSMPTWVSARSEMLWFLRKFLRPRGYVSILFICIHICVEGMGVCVGGLVRVTVCAPSGQ